MKKYNLDKIREECGVFGISNINDASALTALGLHALQHRGQEGCGIVSYDGKNYYSEKRFGLVGDNFNNEDTIKKLPGSFAIGHNRYSTTGGKILRNVQPFFADTNAGGIGVSHNGNFTNAITLRKKLVEDGAIFFGFKGATKSISYSLKIILSISLPFIFYKRVLNFSLQKLNISIYEKLMYKEIEAEKKVKKDTNNKENKNDKEKLY